MLTRITDRKIPCVYIHVYRITKNWGPGPYNSLRHADNKIFFGSLSNAKSKGSAHVLLGEESGKIWTCSCWEKGNFIMIIVFKYGQTWKVWLSPLSLSLYNPFKLLCNTMLMSAIIKRLFTSTLTKVHNYRLMNYRLRKICQHSVVWLQCAALGYQPSPPFLCLKNTIPLFLVKPHPLNLCKLSKPTLFRQYPLDISFLWTHLV